jgi:hypothetical protein
MLGQGAKAFELRPKVTPAHRQGIVKFQRAEAAVEAATKHLCATARANGLKDLTASDGGQFHAQSVPAARRTS